MNEDLKPTIQHVLYYDELGFEHNGTVLFIFPISGEHEEGEYYLMIVDDRDDFNDKMYTAPDGNMYRYADMRRSTECVQL